MFLLLQHPPPGPPDLWANAFAHTHEGVVITDDQGIILDVNPAFSALTGYSRQEAIGQTPAMLKSGLQNESFYTHLWQSLLEHGHWQGEIWNRRKNGENFAERLSISAVRDAAGRTTHYVSIFSDVTSLKETQRQLEDLAYFDPLTRLPNRILLGDRLRQALAQAGRHQEAVAVCYLDLDGFKPVNDSHGHSVGDSLLVELSYRLIAAVRSSDTVARVGGDEFVLLFPELKSAEEAAPLIDRVRHSLLAPFLIGNREFRLSASIGSALFPAEASDPASLLELADQAMYEAKLGKPGKHQRPSPIIETPFLLSARHLAFAI